MKKQLLTAAMALMASASLTAKDADQLRVYINPGHGSWTANDRPCQLVGHEAYNVADPDTTNFFESNTNLYKGFGILEKLRQLGLKYDPTLNQEGERWQVGAARDLSNNIVMSHVKAGPHEGDFRTSAQLTEARKAILDGRKYEELSDAEKAEVDKIDRHQANLVLYNRNLTEIAAEADANNFDLFISIHSNAASEGTSTNYPLYLYRGYDAGKGGPKVAESDVMAQACWPHCFDNEHMVWSYYSRTNPNIRGDLNFYSTSSTYGYLGALKHEVPGFLVEGYFHTYQPARQRAMNWDVDYMEGYTYARGIADYFGLTDKKGSIYGIVRDRHEKFVHSQYKPNPNSADLYLPVNGATVVLKQGDKQIATYTTDDYYNGAYVFRDVEPGVYTIEITHPDYKETEPVEVSVRAGQTAYPAVQLESSSYVPPTINYVTYPDEFNLPAYGAQAVYNLKEDFRDKAVDALAGKNIKRAIARGEHLYILALDEDGSATVLIFDTKTSDVLRQLGTEGTSGEYLALSDIALTADGTLIGINKSLQPFNGPDNVKIYKWEVNSDDGMAEGNPTIWFSTNNGGNYNNAVTGETMSYAGTIEEGRLIYSAVTTGATKALRLTNVAVANGEMASAYHMNINSIDGCNEIDLGQYQINASPAGDDRFILNPSSRPAEEYICAAAAAGVPVPAGSMPDDLAPVAGFRAQMFKYSGHTYMAVPAAQDSEANTAGVTLVDITEGLDKAKAVGTVGAEISPAALSSVATMGQTIVTRDIEDNVTSGHINLYVAGANGLSRFTTEKVDQPVKRASFAYNLKSELSGEDGYTLSFDAVEDAPMANIIFTDMETGEQKTVEAGQVKKTGNTVKVAPQDLGKGKYTWAVEVLSDAQAVAGCTFRQNAPLKSLTRGGVAVIDDENSPAFGKVVVSNGFAQGIDVFSASLEKEGNYMAGAQPWQAGNGASSFRVGQNNGLVYLTDWSDAGAGYWQFDPMKPEAGVTNYLGGTWTKGGSFTVDGKVIGGGATGISFYGTGEDTKMYVFCEDYPAANAGNYLVRYDVGTAEIVDFAPQFTYDNSKSRFANTNVSVQATRHGVLASQVRGSGNNAQSCPCFIFYNNDGEEIFNSYVLEDLNSSSAGAAFNNDLSLFAIGGNNTSISVWSVEWEGEKPSFTKLYDVPGSNYSTEAVQIAWDPANNLYAYIRAEGLRVFALRQDRPAAVTEAPKSYIIEGTSGIDNVVADPDATEGPVEYWNLNGVKVNGDNLAPGIYIRRQGNKAEKFIIR